jgi:hypothetical protein
MAILSKTSFSLKYLNKNSWLIIGISRENLRLLSRNSRISFNKLGHHPTSSFYPKR